MCQYCDNVRIQKSPNAIDYYTFTKSAVQTQVVISYSVHYGFSFHTTAKLENCLHAFTAIIC